MFLTLSVHICIVLLEVMEIVALHVHACKPAILCAIHLRKMCMKTKFTQKYKVKFIHDKKIYIFFFLRLLCEM